MHIKWKYLWFGFGREPQSLRDCHVYFILLPRLDLAGDRGTMIPHLLRMQLSWEWPKFICSHIPKDAYADYVPLKPLEKLLSNATYISPELGISLSRAINEDKKIEK